MDKNALYGQIRSHLQGCLELSLFMKSGIHFFQNNLEALKISIIVMLVLMPLGIPALAEAPEYKDVPLMTVAVTYMARVVLGWLLFLSSMYLITNWLKCRDRYQHFIIIYNWLAVPQVILVLPGIFMMSFGRHEWADIDGYFAFIFLYSLTFIAYMIRHALGVHPMIAIALMGWSVVIDLCVRAVLET